MPYCSILPEKLEFLSLFGFQVIEETDDYYSVLDQHQRTQIIDKIHPFIWFETEDMGDAIQMGTTAIVVGP